MSFSQIVLIALGMLTLAGARPSRASACSCTPETVADAVRASSAVLEAHVTHVLEGETDVSARARVVRTFSGAAREHVELHTARDSAACGFAFEPGKSYLVYATEERGTLHVSACSRTRPMSEASGDLQQLGLGVTPFDPGPGASMKPPPANVPLPPSHAGCASCTLGRAQTRTQTRTHRAALLPWLLAAWWLLRPRHQRSASTLRSGSVLLRATQSRSPRTKPHLGPVRK